MDSNQILAERYQSLTLSISQAWYGLSLLKSYVDRCANDTDSDMTAEEKAVSLESFADCITVDAEQIRLDIDRLIRILQGQNR